MPHPTNPARHTPLKIAVLGAGGGIGQSLSLLLKTELHSTCLAANSTIHIALYDVNRDAVAGAATDLSHINTPVNVTWHAASSSTTQEAQEAQKAQEDPLATCLRDATLVVIPAGVPRKPGMTRDDLFSINARIVTQLARGIAAHCDLSRTFVLLISNPVNSLVPILVETLVASSDARAAQTVARRVFGLTQLDAVRASTFLHAALGCGPSDQLRVPVVGGHSGHTIVPLFSQASCQNSAQDHKLRARVRALSPEVLAQLVHRVQFGGDEVVKAKNGAGSATLSMAYAAAQITRTFAELLLGLRPHLQDTLYANLGGAFSTTETPDAAKHVTEVTKGLAYVSLPLTITKDGIQAIDTQWAQNLTSDEVKLWATCVKELEGTTVKPQ
ncbi:LAFA_0G19504g1_1 [Lachancea sp. 'fantastica']|nr:LAFA_0G19504g1_1 [Lachancea sp. 'fantastica']